jgi:hypothetical protein
MGSIDVSSFNDTKFPGVAYATNPATHDLFKELQNQLNRAAYARKLSARLAVDGKIGAGTQALAKTIGFTNTDTIRGVATHADSIAAGAKAIADSAGVGATVPAPKPAAPPMIFNAQLDTLQPAPAASLVDAFKNMSTPMMLAIGAAAIGAGYYLTKKSK